MKTALIAGAALLVGAALGCLLRLRALRHLRRRAWKLRADRGRQSILRSVTRLFFVTTQFFALTWVCTSYGIAIYATVGLGQVYTMAELSEPAIQTILGAGFLKVLENIFEHNDGAVFGTSAGRSETIESGDKGEER